MEEKFTQQLKEILEMEDQEISLEDKFRDYDNWDSLANLSVIAMLDDEFGVYIETNDFKKLTTVGELMEEVKKRM
jgi:acyl carrier protein